MVDELLDGLTTKFSTVSAEIFAKSKCGALAVRLHAKLPAVDDMSRRLDNLEATVLGDDSDQSKH